MTQIHYKCSQDHKEIPFTKYTPCLKRQTLLSTSYVPGASPGARKGILLNGQNPVLMELTPQWRQGFHPTQTKNFLEEVMLGLSFGGRKKD